MVQNGSNMAPKSTQLGAILGSRTVLETPKSAQENDTQDQNEKKHKKRKKKNLTDNEREARSSVKNWEEIGGDMRNVGYFKQAQEQAQASEQQRAHKQARASTRTAQARTRK